MIWMKKFSQSNYMYKKKLVTVIDGIAADFYVISNAF